MRRVLLRFVLCLCMPLCLSFALVTVSPALAAESVTISGSHAGQAYGNSTNGGQSHDANPNDNTLTITGTGQVGEDACGGYRGAGVMPGLTHPANGNSVIVDGEVGWRVYGGYYYGVILFEGPGYIEANNNNVTINGNVNGRQGVGGVWEAVFGGYAAGVTATVLLPGNDMTAEASGNSVTITSGTIGGNVYGGWARPEAPSLSSATAKATGNTVSISGGTINGNVYGGWADTSGGWLGYTATATDNTVTIGGSPLISGGVYGGYAYSDAFTGNTLNKNSDARINSAQNFEYVNFGYSGDANINTLDTTPGGSSQPGVQLNTNANNITFNGSISGSGSLSKLGAGTLTLNRLNTYSGGTTVKQGLINFANPGNLGMGGITLDGGGLQWAAGSTVDITGRLRPLGAGGGTFDTNGNNVTLVGAISGSGGLTKAGGGTLSLLGVNSYRGGVTVSGGRLAGNTLSLLGSINNNAELEFNQVDNGNYFAAISGSGSLFKSGAGALNMMMNNITQDDLTVSAGAFNIVFGSVLTTSGDVRVDGGALNLDFGGTMAVGGDVLLNAGEMYILLDSNATVSGDVRIDAGELGIGLDSGMTVGGNINVGSGGLDIDWGGSVAVAGDMRVGAGFVDIGFDSILAVAGDVSVDTGALSVDFGSSLEASRDVQVGAGAWLGVHVDDTPAVNAKTVTAQPGAILNVEGYSEDGRYTVVHSTDGIAGDFVLYVAGGPPQTGLDKFLNSSLFNSGRDLAIEQSLVWNWDQEAHGHFNIVSGEFTMEAALADNTTLGAGSKFAWDGASLTKTGAGTLILREANTYSGATTIEAGTLEVVGSLGNNGNYAGNIINHGRLVFNQSVDQTLYGMTSGQGQIEKFGSGTLFFRGASFNAGSLLMHEGTTLISTAASLSDTTAAAKSYSPAGGGATLALTAIGSINKGAMGNSFTMQRGTTLLVEPAGQTTQINALTVELANGSQVGLQGFGYAPILAPGSHTVLTLGGQVTNASSLPITRGTIAVGNYYYSYDNLAWSADGTELTLNVLRDHLLTGDAAITGSSHIVAMNPAPRAFANHSRGLFNYAGPETYLNRLWVTPSYVNVNQSSSGGNGGYLLQTPGVAFGYDRQMDEHIFMGAGVSLSWPDYDGGGTEIQARDLTLGLYAGARLPYGLELDSRIGWGVTRYDQNRTVADEYYSERYNGQNFFAGLGLGRAFTLGNGFSLRPGLAYDYIHGRLGGFEEGAGTFALKTDDYSLDIHRFKAGLDVSWTEEESGLKASGEVYYLGVYGDREASASARYKSNPSSGFSMLGNTLDKDNLGLGLSVSLPLTERWEVQADYNLLLGADTVSQEAALNVIFKF